MLDQERPSAHLPEGHAPSELGDQLGLGVGEPEELAGAGHLPGGLGVDHPRLRVGQEALGQAHLLGALAAHRTEVGQPVEHGHVGHAVGPGHLPGRLEPAGHAEVPEDSVNPCLVAGARNTVARRYTHSSEQQNGVP